MLNNKSYICLLFLSFLVSFKAFGQSNKAICYEAESAQVFKTFATLGEAQNYVTGGCARDVAIYNGACTNHLCKYKTTGWEDNPRFTRLQVIIFNWSYDGNNFHTDCGHVSRTSDCQSVPTEPTPNPDDTVITGITLLNNGLDMKSNSSIRVTKNGSPTNTKNCPEQCSKGDPVNFSTGLMWHMETDFTLKGKSALTNLSFQRTYVAQPALSNKEMGTHWFHNYQTKIFPFKFNGVDNLIWLDEQGGARVFLSNGDNTFQNPSSFFGSLVEYDDYYELTKSDKVKLIFTKNMNIAPLGSLISITEPHGEQVHFSYNNLGLLAQADTGLAGKIIFTYNSNKYLTQIFRERDNLKYQLAYDVVGNLTSVRDFSGHTTFYTYQSSSVSYLDGLMLSVTDQLGRKTLFQYDSQGRVIKETEPGNFARYYAYNADSDGGYSTQVQEIDGSISNFIFDENYHLIKIISPDGSTQLNTWNSKSLVSSITDALGFRTEYQYDTQNNLSYIKRPADSAPTTITYDLNFNKPIEIIPPTGAPINFRIDQITGDDLEVARDGLSLSFTNDHLGNILETNNGITTYSDQTNTDGLKTLLSDARNPLSLSYDVRGRVIIARFNNGRRLNISYDNYNRIIQIRDTNGPTINNTYDVLGRLLTKEIAGIKNKEITKYNWDIRGRLIQITDNVGRKTQYQYNAGRASNLVVDKPSALIDPDGKITLFKYDKTQRLIKKIDALNFTTSFEYNLRGDLIKLTDAKGSITNFSYDSNGRVIRQDSPTVLTNNKGVSSAARELSLYTYDDRDHVIKIERSLASGIGRKTVTTLTYDSFDRLINKTIQKINSNNTIEDSKTSNFTYDPILEADLLKTADNDIEKLSFTHENLPPFKIIANSVRSTNSANPLDLLENDFLITRDFSGEIATLKSTNGKTLISSQYDPAGRLIKTSSGNFLGSELIKFESVIAYDDLGRKISTTNSDGFIQTLAFDQLSRISNINWKNINRPNDIYNISEQLGYNLAGNIVNSKRENANTVFGYDSLNQLTSEYSQNQSREFLYDQTGNRIKDSYNGISAFINNAIIGDKKSPNLLNTYAYDLDGLGNLATIVDEKDKIQKDFQYNLDNKLSTFQLSIGTNSNSLLSTYYYDALGRRVAKNIQIDKNNKTSFFTQSYLYLVDDEKILLSKKGNGEITEYIDGQNIDEHLGEVTTTASKSYVTDHLGSVMNTPASAGKNIFGAFGDRFSESYSQEALALDKNSPAVIYGFAGRELDLESELYYNRARIYDPTLGRFITPDPIELRGGDTHLYRYVVNNPVNQTDPFGLYKFDQFAGSTPSTGKFTGYYNFQYDKVAGEGNSSSFGGFNTFGGSNGYKERGYVSSKGKGLGYQLDLSLNFGFVLGGSNNLQGKGTSVSGDILFGGASLTFDDKNKLVGGSIGIGPGAGASVQEVDTKCK